MRISRGWFTFANSIAGQLLLLIATVMLLLTAGFYILLRVVSDNRVPPPILTFTERQIGVAAMLEQWPANERANKVDQFNRSISTVRYHLAEVSSEAINTRHWTEWNRPPRKKPEGRQSTWPEQPKSPVAFVREINEREDAAEVILDFRLSGNQILKVDAIIPLRPPPNRLLGNSLIALGLCFCLLLVWAMHSLVRPIQRLASTAERFGHEDTRPQHADLSGPTELRGAADAMNRMQDRIHRLLDDRTRMLAAVGHDLRTPVTRLRLRADLITSDEMREAMLRDIAQMDTQLERLLTYFRGGQKVKDAVSLELSSLIETCVNQWSDAGYTVTLGQSDSARVMASPDDLIRLIDNLIDNAVKYAGDCRLELICENRVVCLRVIDHGPGIVLSDRAKMKEPFVRGNEARTLDEKSGFGLGLAIAEQVAAKHDSLLTLRETQGGGLTVELCLPLLD